MPLTVTCATCMFWQPGVSEHARDYAGGDPDFGGCQIGPPELVRIGDRHFEGRWPVTHRDRGCGNHETSGGTIDDPERVGGEVVAFPAKEAA